MPRFSRALSNFSVFVVVLLFAAQVACAQPSPIKVGELAPQFTLSTYEGEEVSLADYKGKIVVLEWFNKGCPFVVNHYEKKHMQKLQADYSEKGVVWLTINSTNTEHTDYLDRDAAQKVAKEWGIEKSVMLKDETGKVGKMYGAKTTPHMYIVNKEGVLVYQGAIDDISDYKHEPGKAKNYVKENLDQVLADMEVQTAETKPYGCSVKYAG